MPLAKRLIVRQCTVKRVFLAAAAIVAGASLGGLDHAQAQRVVGHTPGANAKGRHGHRTGPESASVDQRVDISSRRNRRNVPRTGRNSPGAGPRGSSGAGSPSAAEEEGLAPSAFGTQNWPYTHARVLVREIEPVWQSARGRYHTARLSGGVGFRLPDAAQQQLRQGCPLSFLGPATHWQLQGPQTIAPERRLAVLEARTRRQPARFFSILLIWSRLQIT
jgi:hypothetical protein